MADLSDVKRDQIVGSCMAGASVIKTAELFGVARSTKIMIAFEKRESLSRKQNSGRKRKQSERECWTLRRIVSKDQKNTSLKITAKLNDHLENPVSSKTVRRQLHNARFHRRAAIRKPY